MWPDNQKTQEEETFKSPTYKLLVIIQEVKCDTDYFVEYMYFSLKHQLEFSNMSFSFLLTCNITFSTCLSSTKSSLIARSIMTRWRSSCNSNQRVSHCWSWSWDFLALFSWHSHFHLHWHAHLFCKLYCFFILFQINHLPCHLARHLSTRHTWWCMALLPWHLKILGRKCGYRWIREN